MPYSSPTTRDPRVRVAPAIERRRRILRRPSHKFNLVTKPYQIQPLMIAPVLPGETLQNFLLQAQVWSDPLASGMKNIGWWCEYAFFYVKWRDLVGWDTENSIGKEMSDMMVSNASLAAFQDADGNAWTYCYPGAIDFVLECTKRVVEEYYRDDGEAWNNVTLDSVPLAKIYGKGADDWSARLTLAAAYEDRTIAVPDDMNELELAWQDWAAGRDAGLISMDFSDWMKTYGSTQVREDEQSVNLHRPELLAHFREFTYPVNTVEPTTGNPSTAVGWRVGSRADKRFFLPEPGWIVGYSVVRPKVYLANQQGAVAGAMQARTDWLPAVLASQQNVGHKQFTDTTGPLANIMTTGYWIDIKDLLNYGDQFNNYVTPASGNSGVPFMELPLATGQRRYAASAEIMALFSDTTNGRFRQDGVVSLNVSSAHAQPMNNNLTLGVG